MATDILIAGCGDLGSALGQDLVARGLQVAGLRRSPLPLPGGIRALQADVTQPQTLYRLASLRPAVLVYCVAADAQSDDDYRAQYVDGLRNTLAALGTAGLRHVFFVSSTRVYGQSSNKPLNEETPANPTDFGGRRLLEAEALLETAPCPATVLRLSGIYGPGRHHAEREANRLKQTYGHTCEKLGYQPETNKWRDCLLELENQNLMQQQMIMDRWYYPGYAPFYYAPLCHRHGARTVCH
jgi:nucleoside-diphosphate-sugar epimerase